MAEPSGVKIDVELPRSPAASARARALLTLRYGPLVAPSTLADVRLVVSELASNAYLHGEGRIMLRSRLCPDAVMIEVIDEGTGEAPRICRGGGVDGSGGYGLRLVERLSRRWGAHEGTTHVWAEVPR